MKQPLDPAAVDALLDKVSSMTRDLEALRTQMRNAENVLAAIALEHGRDGEIFLSARTLVEMPKEFALTWEQAHGGHILKVSS